MPIRQASELVSIIAPWPRRTSPGPFSSALAARTARQYEQANNGLTLTPISRMASAMLAPCETSISTCRSFATISSGCISSSAYRSSLRPIHIVQATSIGVGQPSHGPVRELRAFPSLGASTQSCCHRLRWTSGILLKAYQP